QFVVDRNRGQIIEWDGTHFFRLLDARSGKKLLTIGQEPVARTKPSQGRMGGGGCYAPSRLSKIDRPLQSYDQKFVALAGYDSLIVVDLSKKRQLWGLSQYDVPNVVDAAINKHDHLLIAGVNDTIYDYDLRNGARILRYTPGLPSSARFFGPDTLV